MVPRQGRCCLLRLQTVIVGAFNQIRILLYYLTTASDVDTIYDCDGEMIVDVWELAIADQLCGHPLALQGSLFQLKALLEFARLASGAGLS